MIDEAYQNESVSVQNDLKPILNTFYKTKYIVNESNMYIRLFEALNEHGAEIKNLQKSLESSQNASSTSTNNTILAKEIHKEFEKQLILEKYPEYSLNLKNLQASVAKLDNKTNSILRLLEQKLEADNKRQSKYENDNDSENSLDFTSENIPQDQNSGGYNPKDDKYSSKDLTPEKVRQNHKDDGYNPKDSTSENIPQDQNSGGYNPKDGKYNSKDITPEKVRQNQNGDGYNPKDSTSEKVLKNPDADPDIPNL